MAKPSESAKHAYTYIPPSVQKSMAQHMERAIPAHLKKYQQTSGYVPMHAQKAMNKEMQKNLPSHLQKFVDPYMHQNVFYPGGGSPAVVSAAVSSPGGPSNIYNNPGKSSQHFSPINRNQQSAEMASPPPEQPGNSSSDPYDFIMNPGKPAKTTFFFGGGGMLQKVILIAGGALVLIILFSVASNLLSGAGNAQKDKLLKLASTETEIARVADLAKPKITDKNLQSLSSTIKLSVLSSKQEVITALSTRGANKVKDKQITAKDPSNDAALTEGEDNGRFDETYRQLLVKLLSDYQSQLQAVYNSGNSGEKTLTTSADDQTKLLLSSLQTNQQ